MRQVFYARIDQINTHIKQDKLAPCQKHVLQHGDTPAMIPHRVGVQESDATKVVKQPRLVSYGEGQGRHRHQHTTAGQLQSALAPAVQRQRASSRARHHEAWIGEEATEGIKGLDRKAKDLEGGAGTAPHEARKLGVGRCGACDCGRHNFAEQRACERWGAGGGLVGGAVRACIGPVGLCVCVCRIGAHFRQETLARSVVHLGS